MDGQQTLSSKNGSIEGPGSLTEYPGENVIRILVSTDNHIGYSETDPIMGDDSWKTFFEIMELGTTYNVDFFLQSGDLFHVTSPSKKSFVRVSEALSKYCWGDKPVELEMLSNPGLSINNSNPHLNDVNWRNPNLNISFPFFAISGNHDDSTGRDQFSAMDVLHSTGLINHFGKTMTVTDIDIHPILLRKGTTNLALYGLNAIRDERLYKSFKLGKVNFNYPKLPATHNDLEKSNKQFFSLMCVHQNHTGHTNTGFLPEICLPSFLDMVIWGHEHECIPSIKHNTERDFDVLQPGSSVATSLSEAEGKPKHAFILEIRNNQEYSVIPLPLNTVRPFIMEDISLSNFKELESHNKVQIQKFLLKTVDQLVKRANQESERRIIETTDLTDREEILKQIPLPLVRLRVDYSCPEDPDSSYMVENSRRFSNRYVGKVANPNNILQLYKKKHKSYVKDYEKDKLSKLNKKMGAFDMDEYDEDGGKNFANADEEILAIIESTLKSTNLALLSEKGISEALRKTVLNDDKTAMKSFLENQVSKNTKLILDNNLLIESHNIKDFKDILKKVAQPSKIHGSPKDETEFAISNPATSDVFLETARKELLQSGALPTAEKSRVPERRRATDTKIKTLRTSTSKTIISDDENFDLNNENDDEDFILSSHGEESDEQVGKKDTRRVSGKQRRIVDNSESQNLGADSIENGLESVQVSSNEDEGFSSPGHSYVAATLDEPMIIDSDNEDFEYGTPFQAAPAKRKPTSAESSKSGKPTTKKRTVSQNTSKSKHAESKQEYKPVTKLSQSSKLMDMLNSRKTRK
ncbi:hypothetical protein ACO0RG_004158 [Hanseniaspora osmophila]